MAAENVHVLGVSHVSVVVPEGAPPVWVCVAHMYKFVHVPESFYSLINHHTLLFWGSSWTKFQHARVCGGPLQSLHFSLELFCNDN